MPPQAAPLRVLVADGDEDSRESLAVLLASHGYEVCTAGDGARALALYGRERPSVVVMELDLLTHSGYELARRMRAAAGDQVGLVALTSWCFPDHEEQVQAAGFDHYLLKPAELGALMLAIDFAARRPGSAPASPRAA